jgi:hypothetical protein
MSDLPPVASSCVTFLSGDEDDSDLSRGVADGLTPPTFKQGIQLAPTEIDTTMKTQRVLFLIEIPTTLVGYFVGAPAYP